ncbi:hypothetical protein IX51_11045 [uncultured archaeon]|nr:hypothetical protein IX51_11045 [uncultured archaeon]HKJ97244.1 type II toxin-antitoxin system VapC family toxin [Thermoplasmataceae archaeon]
MVTVLDTNILIGLAHGQKNVVAALNDVLDETPAITVINKYEFLRGILISNLQEGKKEVQMSFLNQLEVYDFTSRTAGYCADIYTKLRANGKLINELDVIILGICAENRVRLITNDQDFKGVDKIAEIDVKVLDY